MNKSANQIWKESGTTLSFKDWLSREKEKFSNADGQVDNFIQNKPLNDSIQKTLEAMKKDSGLKEDISNKTIFGINQNVIIVGGVIILGAIAYKFYQSRKS
jgi:CHASE3 domain sensor protein